jgi:uncharacterized protein
MVRAESLNSRKLKVSVTNLQKKVFSRERFSSYLDVGVSEDGLFERGEKGDLKVDLWLDSSPDGIRTKGDIQGYVGMECTRCLKEYRLELHIDVDEFFRRPGLDVVEEGGRRITKEAEAPEEDDYVIDEGTIDLNFLVNDAVMLNLPIKHLCSEDCLGLCSICGKNLNQEECGCSRDSIDPRLEVLRTLLDREEG